MNRVLKNMALPPRVFALAFFAAILFACIGNGVGKIIPAAHALTAEEILPDAAQEARARALALQLRCLVCQNQTIDESDAPFARDMRQFIRERISTGQSDEDIIAFLRTRYGDYILLAPPFNRTTAILWLAPAILFGGGVAGVAIVLMRRRKAGK